MPNSITKLSGHGTSSRLFANTIGEDDGMDFGNKIAWWLAACGEYIEIEDGYYIRLSVNEIVRLIELLMSNEKIKVEFLKFCVDKIKSGLAYSYEYDIKIIDKIPDTLNEERIKIIDFFDSIKDEISEDTIKDKKKNKNENSDDG